MPAGGACLSEQERRNDQPPALPSRSRPASRRLASAPQVPRAVHDGSAGEPVEIHAAAARSSQLPSPRLASGSRSHAGSAARLRTSRAAAVTSTPAVTAATRRELTLVPIMRSSLRLARPRGNRLGAQPCGLSTAASLAASDFSLCLPETSAAPARRAGWGPMPAGCWRLAASPSNVGRRFRRSSARNGRGCRIRRAALSARTLHQARGLRCGSAASRPSAGSLPGFAPGPSKSRPRPPAPRRGAPPLLHRSGACGPQLPCATVHPPPPRARNLQAHLQDIYRNYRSIYSGARPNRRKSATKPAQRARPNRRKGATKPAQIDVENSPEEGATKPAQIAFASLVLHSGAPSMPLPKAARDPGPPVAPRP